MSATAHILAGYRKFAQYSGRTARTEYWAFAAFAFAGSILCFMIAPLLAAVFVVVTGVAGIAAGVRRLHDTGRRGWWLLLPGLAVPAWLVVWIASAASAMAVRQDPLDDDRYFLGATLVMLCAIAPVTIWLAGPSQTGANKYGPNPTEVTQ